MPASPSTLDIQALSDDVRQTLLRLARQAIASHWQPQLQAQLDALVHDIPGGEQPLACFVTLHLHGELRGCIGCLEPTGPLASSLIRYARAAAFEDPRFPPLRQSELPQCTLSLSLLGPLAPLPAGSRQELTAALTPGVDGLWLISPGHKATFLPAVWHELPGRPEFINQLLRKGGWPAGTWPEKLQAWRYSATEVSEQPSRLQP
ncbi:AmmeMemoRadiSam system protein A [Pseudaeromonas sharmana]|uniref:AmmeMemoRadiSam system protein A n=1 Tax=Pseudaeromonas sharmana TaxID=328412 RepID=A0ABV8CME8_9GAMM